MKIEIGYNLSNGKCSDLLRENVETIEMNVNRKLFLMSMAEKVSQVTVLLSPTRKLRYSLTRQGSRVRQLVQ